MSQSTLSKIIVASKYARPLNGQEGARLETWSEIVERVIAGNVRGFDVSEHEIQRLRYFLGQMKASPGGRGLWMSGTKHQEKLGSAALVNPLHEDTRILTKEFGWVPIKEVCGQEVTVCSSTKLFGRDGGKGPSANQVWAKAVVSDYQIHPCKKITYRDRWGNIYSVIASYNHRWFVRKASNFQWERVTTLDLKPGLQMPRVTPSKNYDLSVEAFKHGLFFGDGGRGTGMLQQFGKDNVDIVKKTFHPSCVTFETEDKIRVYGCPLAWSKLPEGSYLADSKYVFGFLAGYFAADGNMKSDGSLRLFSARKEELEQVAALFERVGISVGKVYFESDSSNFSESRELWCLAIHRMDVPRSFFLKDKHIEIWDALKEKGKSPSPLTIVNVEEAGEHRVICATVPEYEQFVIEGFCLTSNCWGFSCDDWMNYVIASDLLMLGGGVGLSVEEKYVSQLPRLKKDVTITHRLAKDTDYIVPDTREGWAKLLYKVLEAWFVTGKGFSYSTICIRGPGEPIRGFGGVSSGPRPLVRMVEKLCALFVSRQGKKLRPIDAADIMCCIAEMVVSGNVRRSALLIQGDADDREFLKAKRWDLGTIPSHRSKANFSVVASDVDHDLRPLFWQTYYQGEPFGIVNIANIRKYGRIGEEKKDSAVIVNPCGEASLESGECCNIQDINLVNITNREEFAEAAKLMHRWGKRVACGKFHWEKIQEVATKNHRVGTGITGCLQRPDLFNPEVLDYVYQQIQTENILYSKELGIDPSIKTTVIKPSGTLSKVFDSPCEGIHPAYSRYFIQRIRLATNDALIPKLRAAGHHIEPEQRIDGTLDPDTLVVDFYVHTPEGVPCADEGFDTWKQLDAVKMAQKYWADQSISVTVYYKDGDVPKIQEWLRDNLDEIKTVSFLRHSDHGFKQAPKEKITKEQYEKLSAKLGSVELGELKEVGDIDGIECEGGVCPIR